MNKLNCTKALKVKANLVNRINTSKERLLQYNSVEEGVEVPYDAAEELKSYLENLDRLIIVKAALHKANLPVYDTIIRLAEIKGVIKFLQSLNVKEGKVRDPYSRGEAINYKSTIGILERDKRINDYQEEIIKLQSELEYHNANSIVELPEVK